MRVAAAAAVAVLLAACVSAPKPAPTPLPAPGAGEHAPVPEAKCPPAHAGAAAAAAPRVPQESLYQYVPSGAIAVLVVRANAFGLLRRYLEENPELRDELSRHFAATTGIDLPRIEGAVLSVTGVTPTPEGALLLRLPPDTQPIHAPEVGRVGDAALYKFNDMFLARVPGGVVVGFEGGVRKQLALARGELKPLDAASPLARALGDPNTVDVAIAVDGTSVPQLGLDRGALTLGGDGRVTLALTGDPAKLEQLRVLYDTIVRKAMVDLEAEKARAPTRSNPFEGAIAIASFYGAQKMVREIEPKLVGNTLVSEYRLPRLEGTAAFVPIMGVLAAVAVPAFTKYIKRSKTIEARTTLRELHHAANAYREQHAGKKFAFPPSTDWTPARGCCGQPGDKCAPDPKAWNAPAWRAFGVPVQDPHYFQYRFTSKGRGANATFSVEARGDLDCDGVFSSYRLEDGATEPVVERGEE
jgi:type II secretory pathway pseudopilin PulG